MTMKSSFLNLVVIALLFATAQAAPPASRTLQLDDGMPLIVTPTADISSATNKTGEPVSFSLVQDCKVDGIVVIPKGALVYGNIEWARHSKMFGQQGELAVSFTDTKAVDGSVLKVRSSVDRKGNIASDTKDTIAGMLPYGIGMLRNGKDAILPTGVPLTIFVDGTSKFKVVQGQKPKLIPVK